MITSSLNNFDRKKAELYKEVRDFIVKPLKEVKLNELINKYFSIEI